VNVSKRLGDIGTVRYWCSTVRLEYQQQGGPGTLWCGEWEGVTTKSVTGDSPDAFPLKMSPTAAKEKEHG